MTDPISRAYREDHLNELHGNDPRLMDGIYASGGRVHDKWVHQLNTGAVGPVAVAASFIASAAAR